MKLTTALTLILTAGITIKQLILAPEAQGDDTLFGSEINLTVKERKALLQAEGYLNGAQYPVRNGHRVMYLYGAGQPVLICSPLNVCLVELEQGEKIGQGGVHLGDQARWQVSPTVGAGGRTHLVVKPTDVGLETTMVIITDKRTYYLRLVSRLEDHMPAIAWVYPGNLEARMKVFYAAEETGKQQRTFDATGEDISRLDFNYIISGCGGCLWRPLRVYNDGEQTVIQLGKSVSEVETPALLVVSGDAEGLANYRLRGDRYVVDHVFDEAILVAGVGRSRDRVKIKRVHSQ